MEDILGKIRRNEIEYTEPEDGLVKPTYITEKYVVQEAKDSEGVSLRKNVYLCRLLYERGVNVPKVFELENDPVHAVFERLKGVSLEDKDSFGKEEYLKAVENAGRELAKIHSVEVSGYGKPDEKQDFERGKYSNWREFVEDYVEGTLNWVESERFTPIAQKAAEIIEEDKIPENPYSGVLHMDFTHNNIIVNKDLEAQIIDFDGSLHGVPLLDLMYAEIIMSKHGEEVLEAFKKGYKAVRDAEVSEEDRKNYTALAVMRDLRGGEWCLRNNKDVDLDEWSEGLSSIVERLADNQD